MQFPESTPASRYRSALAAVEAQQSAISARKGTYPTDGTGRDQAVWLAEHNAMLSNMALCSWAVAKSFNVQRTSPEFDLP